MPASPTTKPLASFPEMRLPSPAARAADLHAVRRVHDDPGSVRHGARPGRIRADVVALDDDRVGRGARYGDPRRVVTGDDVALAGRRAADRGAAGVGAEEDAAAERPVPSSVDPFALRPIQLPWIVTSAPKVSMPLLLPLMRLQAPSQAGVPAPVLSPPIVAVTPAARARSLCSRSRARTVRPVSCRCSCPTRRGRSRRSARCRS